MSTCYFSDRLTGFYAFLIFFLSTLWRHCASGPNHDFEPEAEDCARTPWLNLLYINNFYEIVEDPTPASECLGVTWYLANDMQFFLIAPPIIYVTWHWKKIGFALIFYNSVKVVDVQ